ncbi:MAG: hypothetical protein SGI98_00550 [Verrucomicrobiota bacterium]|nr:hypothetical protein [Verrucomicrobiota bacterium]
MKKTTITSIILLLVILGTVVMVYRGAQETKVTIRAEKFTNPVPPIAVSLALGNIQVIEEIRAEYAASLKPKRDQLVKINQQLKDISETLADLESQKTDFENNLVHTGEKFEDQAKEVWNNASAELEQEYETTRDEYLKKFQEKAATLQTNFKEPKLPSVDAYSSAYRLSLYNVGTNINAVAERQWSDEVFQEWVNYQKEWHKRMDKAMIKGRVIDDKKKSELAKLKVEAPVVENQKEPLMAKQARMQIERDEIQAFLDNATEPYLPRILSIYRATAMKSMTTDQKGVAVFKNIELSPGSYYILGELTDESGTRIWRTPFLIRENHHNTFIIKPDGGKTLREILENGP